MNVAAHLNNLRVSPRKIRLVAKLIVGMPAADAMRELQFLPKYSSAPLLKLLKSAVANAEHNFQLKKDDLIVLSAIVNQGPTMKRMMPRAKGRGATIRKRMSHVSIILAVKKEEEKKSAPATGGRKTKILNPKP